MKKLPNLDGLRFIAATLVLIFHVDFALAWNHYKIAPYKIFPFYFGEMAVVLFFVLSGFLITYLLLKEKATQKIAVGSFYLKRVLRIWPLYYLIIILSFFIFNKLDFFNWNLVTTPAELSISQPFFVFLVIIICPNVALLATTSLGYANPTWSIGVEEQFYLLWPHIMKRKRPGLYIAAIIIIVFFLSQGALAKGMELLTNAGIITVTGKLHTAFFVVNKFFTFPYSFKIDSMAIGAAGAMIAIYRPKYLRYIFSVPFQVIFYLVFLFSIFFLLKPLPYQVFSVFFVLMILNLSLNKSTILKLENNVLNYLGKISYGIYIFHSLTVIPAIKFVTAFLGMQVNLFSEILICIISMLLTVAIAALSYKYFESYFLKMKDKLSTSFKIRTR